MYASLIAAKPAPISLLAHCEEDFLVDRALTRPLRPHRLGSNLIVTISKTEGFNLAKDSIGDDHEHIQMMKTKFNWIWLIAMPACAQVYQYTGEFFTDVVPPYTLTDRVVGSIEFSPPLPAFASNLDSICYITDFNFSDGVQTLNPSNAVVCSLDVDTDGEGRIVKWVGYIREANVMPGDPISTIDISEFGDNVGSGPAGSDACAGFSLTEYAFNSTPATWTATLPTGTPASYAFTGSPFTAIEPPYSLGGVLTGSFQVSNPLPAGQSLTDIGHAITSFSFDDSIAIRTELNSEICQFDLKIDMAGHIKEWHITVREVPSTMGVSQHSISTSFLGDFVGSGVAGNFDCGPLTLSPFASVNVAGTWDDPLPMGVPTTYQYEGALFTSVQAPYTTSQNVSGFVQFNNPLLPFLSNVNMEDCLLDYTFDDGLQIRSPLDSEVCGFYLSTDLNGHMTSWSATLRALNFVTGQPQHTIQFANNGDAAGSVTAGAEACSPASFVVVGSNEVPGTWSDPLPPSTPAVYFYLGDFYETASLPFSRRHRVRGRISLASPLAPNMNNPSLDRHISNYQFHDGLVKLNKQNSFYCTASLATDDNGDIIHWDFSLNQFAGLEHQVRIQNKGLQLGDFAAAVLSGSCSDAMVDYTASTDQTGTWIRMCPILLTSLEDWPQPSNILDLLGLNCGW